MEFVLFYVFAFYLVPWIVAAARNHESHASILALTLLFGWTGVGWLLALAWALSQRPPEARSGSRNFEFRVVDGGRAPFAPNGSNGPTATAANQVVRSQRAELRVQR